MRIRSPLPLLAILGAGPGLRTPGMEDPLTAEDQRNDRPRDPPGGRVAAARPLPAASWA